tara:strand:+ start:2044 stop:2556 length:513 start_codon:yes stop_codon:yes gene_type:complete
MLEKYSNFKPLKINILKKILLISLFSLFFSGISEAQEISTEKLNNSFIEWNFGVAKLADENFIFPGTSALWGSTYINENNLIFEYEAGFAFPSLVTGKLGIGKKFNNTRVIIGVRPFPFHVFMQSSFTKGKKGYWIGSIEFNPLNSDAPLSIGSKAIFNFGYRWNIIKNK